MKILQHIAQISVIFLFLGYLFFSVKEANASHCKYDLSESGCTVTYNGQCDSSDPSDPNCSKCTGVELAPDGIVCATSPNTCSFSSCTATNTQTRCSAGKCSNSQIVEHPWSVCSDNRSTCTAPPSPSPSPPGQEDCYSCIGGAGGYCRNDGVTTGTCATNCSACQGSTPTPTPVPVAQCLDIKLYDAANNRITNPAAQIKAGDVIKIAVSGSTNEPGGLTKARFRINRSSSFEETTTKNSASEFYIQKTVTAGPFRAEGQVYNPTLGWR